MTKILCAIDDAGHSAKAIDVGVALAKALNAELTFIAVNQLVGGYGGGGVPALHWTQEQESAVLARALAQARETGVASVDTIAFERRDPARQITSYAEENGYDHIVVGTGGKGSMLRMMLGSVSRDVADRAHCPVTIAR
ncbi:MAG: universal stress protein [Rhizobiales bacterium]|nr:universal stress protein [Hyphomicrobiales bacterium]